MVEIKEAGTSGWKRAAPGGFIESNTIISTGLKSSAVIVLGNSRLEVRPLTMLTMEELVQKEGIEETAVYLRTGRVRAEVRPPTGIQADFRVKSPSVTASVRGTTFEFDGKNLWVGDGRVLLAGSNGQKVYVAKGQRSYVDGNNQNRIAPPFEAETARLRPVIPELNNTDSAGSANAGVPELTPGVVVHFILDW